jgi:outer membrane protein assembly factor BamB
VSPSPLLAGGHVSVLEANQFRSFGMEDGDPDQPFLATVDAATGQAVGRIALPGLFAEMVAPPVLTAGELWLPQTDALLVADHATGRLRARVDLPAPPVGPPLLAGGRLLQLTADHTVQVVDPATGTTQRRLTVAEGEPAGSGRLTAGDGWLAVQHGGALTLVNAE